MKTLTASRCLLLSAIVLFTLGNSAYAKCMEGMTHKCIIKGKPGTRECVGGHLTPCIPDEPQPQQPGENPIVIAAQPDIKFGGRAIAIAADPDNSKHILAAAEAGGAFETYNGGSTWRHVDALHHFNVTDLAFAPIHPSKFPGTISPTVVVATVVTDFRTDTNGPLWVSGNGGLSWRMPSIAPPSSSRCPTQISGYSVAFDIKGNAFAATECGVAISNDFGATWKYVEPDSTIPVDATKTQSRTWSVIAYSGHVNVSTQTGIYYSTDSGTTWTKADGSPSVEGFSHAFAASPYSADSVFFASHSSGEMLFLSHNGGKTWEVVPSKDENGGRPLFVRTQRRENNEFFAYFGNGIHVWRQRFRVDNSSGNSSWSKVGDWEAVSVDHADSNDIAFDSSGEPLLLASDGGIHTSNDGGKTWTLVDGGKAGFHALEIYDVTGQLVTEDVSHGTFHQDLYFGTQDNYLHASSDAGKTWPYSTGGDVWHVQVEPRSRNHAGTAVTFRTLAQVDGAIRNVNRLADAHLQNERAWPDAQGGDPYVPFLLPRSGFYIQELTDTSVTPVAYKFMFTNKTGAQASWHSVWSTDEQFYGKPDIASGTPTMYVTVLRPGTTSDGVNRLGLVRLEGYGPPYGTVTTADADVGVGGLGIFGYEMDYHSVVGVDRFPFQNHLLIADIDTDEMKESFDGGKSWQPNLELTKLITDNSRYRFHDSFGQSFVTTIAFDPYNLCDVLLGTVQNGIFQSRDGGATWTRLRDSGQIPRVSSFYFPPTGYVYASSYGRGLWKLAIARSTPPSQCTRPTQGTSSPPAQAPLLLKMGKSERVPFKGVGLTEVCSGCQYILVKYGAISDIDLDGLHVRKIYIVGGSLHQFDSASHEVPLGFPNAYNRQRGKFSNNSILTSVGTRNGAIRGLVVENDILRAVIISRGEVPTSKIGVPHMQFIGDGSLGFPALRVGGRALVVGEGFSPNSILQIWLDRELLSSSVTVDANGRFRTDVTINRMPGTYELAAEQKNGKRINREKVTFRVVGGDPSPKVIK